MAQANLIQTSISGRTLNALASQGDGLILPKLSSADRTALVLTTADAGLTVYDTTATAIYTWSGTAWLGATVAYSEGTWVAGFTPGGGGTITLDPANKTGRWARVGNLVTVTLHANVLAINAPLGSLTVTGLPYPPVVGFEGAVLVTVNGLNNLARTQITGNITGSTMKIYHYDSGTLQDLGLHVLAGSDWYITATYLA